MGKNHLPDPIRQLQTTSYEWKHMHEGLDKPHIKKNKQKLEKLDWINMQIKCFNLLSLPMQGYLDQAKKCFQ